MGFIKEMLDRAKVKKQKVAEYEENDRIVTNVSQRKLSHNERELIKSMEEEKAQYIKEALQWDRRKRMAEDRKKSRDMMKFDTSLFNNKSILKDNKKFLLGGEM